MLYGSKLQSYIYLGIKMMCIEHKNNVWTTYVGSDKKIQILLSSKIQIFLFRKTTFTASLVF